MSAAQAGQGSNGDAGQAQGGEAAQAQGFDASALQQQLAATAGGVDQLRQQFGQFLESAPWQQQEASQEQEQGLDLSFLDEGYGDPAYGQQDRDAASQQFTQQVQEMARQIAQQQVAPMQEAVQDMRREQAIRDLVTAHPEFQDAQVAERIAGPDGLARQWAEAMGTPEQAQNPAFWRLVLMADRAAQTANAEAEQQAQQAATLESGNGSGLAASQQNEAQQRVDRIFDGSRKGASVLPFG